MKRKIIRYKIVFSLLFVAIMILVMPGMRASAAEYNCSDSLDGHIIQADDVFRIEYVNYIHVGYNSGRIIYVDTTEDWFPDSRFVGCLINDAGVASAETYDVFYIDLASPLPPLDTTSPSSPAEGYYRSLRDLISAINMESGETVYYETGTALPYSVMKALENNPEDTLVFKCEYKGNKYTFTIHGSDVKGKISHEIPWYGPYWLAQNFFSTTVIEPLEPIVETK